MVSSHIEVNGCGLTIIVIIKPVNPTVNIYSSQMYHCFTLFVFSNIYSYCDFCKIAC